MSSLLRCGMPVPMLKLSKSSRIVSKLESRLRLFFVEQKSVLLTNKQCIYRIVLSLPSASDLSLAVGVLLIIVICQNKHQNATQICACIILKSFKIVFFGAVVFNNLSGPLDCL